eukprot:PITA_11840
MRLSCNGCRVLRKGCTESCILRPCLQWIRTAESQANATIFLAKFYGRAGLMNLISNGPDNLRPAIFRSLLYEACGRVVNPVSGSIGLLCSGNWAVRLQAGVESILRGNWKPQTPVETMAARKLQKSVKTRQRSKGFSHSKSKRNEGERGPVSDHVESISKSDYCGDVANVSQKTSGHGDFDERYVDKYSMFSTAREQEEFACVDQAQMQYCHDLSNPKTSETETSFNAVELELTLGSKVSFRRTPDKISSSEWWPSSQ